jgi:hypothetical protein
LEARAPDPAARRRSEAAAAEIARQERAFLAAVPADLRAEVAAALADPGRGERLIEWRLSPVARRAALPAELPRGLVRVMLDDPEAMALHECGRCGLRVPIRPGETYPPKPAVALFPACPACGGRTGYSAYEHPGGAW